MSYLIYEIMNARPIFRFSCQTRAQIDKELRKIGVLLPEEKCPRLPKKNWETIISMPISRGNSWLISTKEKK